MHHNKIWWLGFFHKLYVISDIKNKFFSFDHSNIKLIFFKFCSFFLLEKMLTAVPNALQLFLKHKKSNCIIRSNKNMKNIINNVSSLLSTFIEEREKEREGEEREREYCWSLSIPFKKCCITLPARRWWYKYHFTIPLMWNINSYVYFCFHLFVWFNFKLN